MSPIRIVFLGTPKFAYYHLKSLLENSNYSVTGVVTQPDRPRGRKMHVTPCPVKELALEHHLRVISPETVKSDEVLREIENWRADAAVVVAFGQLLPQTFLNLFPLTVVNVHASLLPRWRGAAPIQRAIEAGDRETGVSLQRMALKLDAGDVIGSYRLKIDKAWDAVQLQDELMPLGARLLRDDFLGYLRGDRMATPQDETLVTYARKIEKSEARIDWSSKSAVQIRNQIRAFALGPGSVTTLGGRPLKIVAAEALSNRASRAGEIIFVDREGFIVACHGGALRVTVVQPESKTQMSAHDFLLGHKLKVGDRFE